MISEEERKNMWNSCIIPKMNIWEGKYPCGQQNCWVTCHCGEIME